MLGFFPSLITDCIFRAWELYLAQTNAARPPCAASGLADVPLVWSKPPIFAPQVGTVKGRAEFGTLRGKEGKMHSRELPASTFVKP